MLRTHSLNGQGRYIQEVGRCYRFGGMVEIVE